ncbi:rod shape-determining protein [Streptomyces durbertensis]|uniref:Cell shape-determining protein MreB n=1 Tax=Streptomyces durbertensis TaxID=2448886 RepID=A0ABR6EID5_9ACTN|nr:rod shape-determining protein [Streptomyces durbertensis]MBB1245067.1 rod shape-determining protein [Streptomyces durbertensis]
MGKRTSFGSRDIGIDLGTANTLVYARGKGVVLNEPSVVAVDSRTGQVRAVGSEAQQSMGRTPGSIVATRPLAGGVISDLDAAEAMLRRFIRKARPARTRAPRVIICVPSGITEVERQAVLQTAARAGARSVHLVEEPMAAAIGAGLPVYEPQGSMVVDIGGGSTEVAVISLGGTVTSCSSRVAGDTIDATIAAYIHREHSITIGERTAERIKTALGQGAGIQVRGRDKTSTLPKYVDLTTDELLEVIEPAVRSIVEVVASAFDDCPPELYGDIMERGIVLTGGGALLYGLDERISRETGMPVVVADDPLTCVALGTGRCLEEYDKLVGLFGSRPLLTTAA